MYISCYNTGPEKTINLYDVWNYTEILRKKETKNNIKETIELTHHILFEYISKL